MAKILIEKGYFARSIPSEYGGYGERAILLKVELSQRVCQIKNTTSNGWSRNDMLVPTLLELGTEEQKQNT